ncbi:hypothetical protein SUGI_0362600 [Cryptomeria japonica]|nr:hypothetical protein SUGI_0362600 [Cryptomeria japonica]
MCGRYLDTVEDTSIPKSPPPSKDDVRIIVFVDDLDRCEDTVILQVLSAVNLVLAVCEINVIIGMDKKMIARAIAHKYKDNININTVGLEELAEKYLSKIVQLPLALPDSSHDETMDFLEQQLGEGFEETANDDSSSNKAHTWRNLPSGDQTNNTGNSRQSDENLPLMQGSEKEEYNLYA